MRKRYLALIIIFLSILPAGAHSSENGSYGNSKLSGRIEIGPIWINTTSQTYAGRDNRKTASLNDDDDSYDIILPLVLFDLRYRFENSNNEIYAGTPVKDAELALALGVKRYIGNRSNIDLSLYLSPFSDVWQDPYVAGVNREETDVFDGGVYFSYNNVLDTDLLFSYSLEYIDVDRDIIGDTNRDLRRDGQVHETTVGYRFDLSDGHFITPKLEYTYADIDGKSESYDGYMLKLNYMLIKPERDFAFSFFVSGAKNHYKKTHPIFSKTRADDKYRLLAVFTLLKPFGLDDYFSNIVAGYFTTDSNIDFFDSRSSIAAITLGYQF
jgi:hypothetical protein